MFHKAIFKAQPKLQERWSRTSHHKSYSWWIWAQTSATEDPIQRESGFASLERYLLHLVIQLPLSLPLVQYCSWNGSQSWLRGSPVVNSNQRLGVPMFIYLSTFKQNLWSRRKLCSTARMLHVLHSSLISSLMRSRCCFLMFPTEQNEHLTPMSIMAGVQGWFPGDLSYGFPNILAKKSTFQLYIL